jgi:hypothetical protein
MEDGGRREAKAETEAWELGEQREEARGRKKARLCFR